MKFKIIISVLAVFFWTVSALGAEQAADTAQSNPGAAAAYVAEPDFDFQTAVEGTEVLHDFIVENTGGATLLIEKVTTSCGCTTASYTKEIPPGSKGKISIKANTEGYAGSRFFKNITVYCNDPGQKEIRFRISGQVEKFVSIEPRNISLNGVAGQKIQAVTTIRFERKYPFNIVESHAQKGENIRFNLERKPDSCVLTVENMLAGKGSYVDRIILKTDHPAKPEITVPVYGNIRDEK
jgi:hypothetical protein